MIRHIIKTGIRSLDSCASSRPDLSFNDGT